MHYVANQSKADTNNRPSSPGTSSHNRPTPTLEIDRLYYSNQPPCQKPRLQEQPAKQNSQNQEVVEEPDDFSDEDNIPEGELEILRTHADNSVEDWP